jgi:hypothetical protein
MKQMVRNETRDEKQSKGCERGMRDEKEGGE